MGVPFKIDQHERNLIFNICVMDKSLEKFGKMDDVLNAAMDFQSTVWFAVQMLNEDAEIWNEDHKDNQKPLVDELKVKRSVDGMGGIVELQTKVSEAILKGLPKEQVEQVEELGKNLIAAQSGMKTLKLNRQQRRARR
ncbi:MAG: hypothetical protein N2376_03795 [Clostridia bacterium]|nr:hypothetical protein [Clostridia bacterium]